MQEIWDLIVGNFIGCLIVFSRVTGIFTFNPVFSRSNTPMRIKIAMSIAMTIVMLSSMGGSVGYIPTSVVDFVFVLLKEAAVGLVFGFFTNLILTVLIYAGELIDNQTGLGMAKAMDPSTGVTMPIFANIYYYIFIVYFFITNGHLSYIKLFALSYDTLPVGFALPASTVSLSYLIVQYLGTVLELAVKFAMPLVATELIVEFSIGILMKAVPTIQVFVINVQLKILVGLFVLMIFAGPMSDFLQKLLDILWENLFAMLKIMGT